MAARSRDSKVIDELTRVLGEGAEAYVRQQAAHAAGDTAARAQATEEVMSANRRALRLVDGAPWPLRKRLLSETKHSKAIAMMRELDRG